MANNNANIDKMVKQLKKAEFFLECIQELADKLNAYQDKDSNEE